MPLLARNPANSTILIPRNPKFISRVGTHRRALALYFLSCFQEEAKAQKKKHSAMKKELQETSEALLTLLEELRK